MVTKKYPWSQTHPWLDFDIRAGELSGQDWVCLGELASKIRHLSLVPLSPTFRRRLQVISLKRGAKATTAIEGNTLSDEEIDAIITAQGAAKIAPSKAYQKQEIENIVAAFNKVVTDLEDNPGQSISTDLLKEWNRLILQGGLPLEDHVVPGQYSNARLVVGNYRALPPEHRAEAMEKFCLFLNQQMQANAKTQDKEEQNWKFAYLAAVTHLFFVWIHPFGDGNGRTARLLEFFICLKGGFPYTASHLLANHYNDTRDAYYAALEQASKRYDRGGQGAFVRYAMTGLRDQLVTHIDEVMTEIKRVTWKNYIYETLSDKSGPAWDRRRTLALDMVKQDSSARQSLVNSDIYDDPKITPRMISQDINDLIKIGLLSPHPDKPRDAILSDILLQYQPGHIEDWVA